MPEEACNHAELSQLDMCTLTFLNTLADTAKTTRVNKLSKGCRTINRTDYRLSADKHDRSNMGELPQALNFIHDVIC